MRFPHRLSLALPFALAFPSVAAHAQSSVAAGVTAGSAQLTDQRSEQAISGVVLLEPAPWISLSAVPSIIHVTDLVSGRHVSSNGFGDLPLAVAARHEFRTASSPLIAGALTFVLPTGNAACGLGSGESSLGLDVGVAASPSAALHLSADASRSISGLSSQSVLSAPHATSLLAGAGYDVTAAWRADVSLGIDVGQADSTQALSRVLGGGLTRRVKGPLALTVDGSVGLTSGSPKWVVSIGFGTVFAGTSPVGLSAPLRRLKSSFTGGVSRRSVGGKIGC